MRNLSKKSLCLAGILFGSVSSCTEIQQTPTNQEPLKYLSLEEMTAIENQAIITLLETKQIIKDFNYFQELLGDVRKTLVDEYDFDPQKIIISPESFQKIEEMREEPYFKLYLLGISKVLSMEQDPWIYYYCEKKAGR